MKKKVKKYLKIGLGVTVVAGLGIIIYKISNIESTPSVYPDGFKDTIDEYEDKEFYYLTHNSDGTLNEYGKSLDD